MKDILEGVNPQIRQYFKILNEEIPEFLYDYILTPEMQRQAKISPNCGRYYSNIFGKLVKYSNLEHSIAVALIIWHFTHDKKQTLAGLFHDIATPVFKHCVDFMNGDYEKQETTEELTTSIIRNSKQIMTLLKRDSIKVEQIDDYHKYPIADNDTPKLSADRLEYTFSNGFGVQMHLWDLEKIKQIYNDIEVQINENDVEELGFKTVQSAEEFVHVMKKLSSNYIDGKTKFSMQFLADIMKKMYKRGIISKNDLYELPEQKAIEKIENCGYDNISNCFKIWKNATKVKESDVLVNDKYCVNIEKIKVRYINPLVRNYDRYIRVSEISSNAKEDIENALNFNTKKYAYLDFDF